MTDDDDREPGDEPTVKALLDEPEALREIVDEATRRELERWFGLPSFEQVDERAPKEDPGVTAVRERRAKATAAVDPAMLAAIDARNDVRGSFLHELTPLPTTVDRPTALADLAMIDRGYQIGEPRDFELPQGIDDDLRDCAPQALLRDLHRPETDFTLQLEIVDYLAEVRVDAIHEARVAMTTRWKIATDGPSPRDELRAELARARADRARPWIEVLATNLPNRRVTE